MNNSQRFTLIVAGALFTAASALARPTLNSPARPNTPEDQPQPSAIHNPTALPSHSAATESAQTSKTSDQPIADALITTKVKSKLARAKDVKNLDISVETIDGVVYLSGTLPNNMAVQKAVAAAKRIKGVQRVDSSDLKSQSQSTGSDVDQKRAPAWPVTPAHAIVRVA